MSQLHRVSLRAVRQFGLTIVLCCALAKSISPARSAEPPLLKAPGQSVAAPPVALAAQGKALLPVVVAAGASEPVKATARDLARYLGLISGTTFKVEEGDGGRGIVLGTLRDFPSPAWEKALVRRGPFDGAEAFIIRATPGRVMLLANTETGVSHAAYRMLQELGCRWLAPAPQWEIVPTRTSLNWSQDVTDRPAILSRVIAVHTAFGATEWAAYNPEGASPTDEFKNWSKRNLLNQSFVSNAGHNWAAIILANKAKFTANPEYYPLINGKRLIGDPRYGQPDIGNPAVRRMFVEYALDYFRKNPKADMVSVDPNDGGLYSQSPEFKALGTISDAVFGMANEVARAVQKEFPGKMVGLYSYREYSEPPSFPLEPNVHVEFTGLIIGSKFSRDEILAQWAARGDKLGFYDYYAPYEWYFDQLPGANASSLNYITTRIRNAAAANASSIVGQSSNSWILLGMGHWIAAQLMWNPAADVDKLRTDYLQSAFGPAAATMDRFYKSWNPDSRPIISDNLIYSLYQDVAKAEAEAEAAGRTDVIARLDHVKQYLRFQELDFKLRDLKKDAPYELRRQAFIDLFTHLYRTRFTYTTNYFLGTQNLWQQRAELSGMVLVRPGKPKEVVDATLTPTAKNSPWKAVDKPQDAAEIAANFASGMAYFKSPAIVEKPFGADLVPVAWPVDERLPPSRSTLIVFQGGSTRLALYSTGTPLTFNLKAGKANGTLTQRNWKVSSQAGATIAEGTIGPEALPEQQNFTVPVPGRGVYVLEATDTGAGFLTVEVPPTTPATILVRRGVSQSESGPDARIMRYFYVPKGTRTINYFFGSWAPGHKVMGPDFATVFEGENGRAFRSIEVPPGQDGKVWSWRIRPGVIWMANIPSGFAQSPAHLMVPREVAQQDGLTLR